MGRQEERNNAKKIFQTGTNKQKFQYLWDYYRWYFIISALFLSFIISMIYNLSSKKDYVLQGYFLNVYGSKDSTSQIKQDFLNEYPLETPNQDILLDTSFFYDSNSAINGNSYETIQTLLVKVASGEIDFIVADVNTMQQLSYNQYFYNLSDVLSKSQLDLLFPYCLYYDNAVMKIFNEIDYTEDIPNINNIDPSNPNTMQEPIPVMIQINVSDKLSALYPNSKQEYAFAFVVTSKHTDKAKEFFDFLI